MDGGREDGRGGREGRRRDLGREGGRTREERGREGGKEGEEEEGWMEGGRMEEEGGEGGGI